MENTAPSPKSLALLLRDVVPSDLPDFFEQQLDPVANRMAAFTVKDPTDKEAFMARWSKFLVDETIFVQSILFDGHLVGHVVLYKDEELEFPEVSYWIGKPYWGQGLASRALAAFLLRIEPRPLYARAAKDNLASLRVLEKCGFIVVGEDKAFSNSRGEEFEEFLLILR